MAAGVVSFLFHTYLYGDALLEFFHVADDSHVPASLGMKGAQSADGVLQSLSAERAKSLVDEEGIYYLSSG